MARLPTLVPRDDREARVLERWRMSGLAPTTTAMYLVCVRRFRAHCLACDVDEVEKLTLADVMSYMRSYSGRRRGRRVKWSSRISMRHAVHAWACALRELGLRLPAWRPRRPERSLSSTLAAYAQHRRSHRGIAASTLVREIDLAEEFLSHLRRRGKSVRAVSVADIDSFVASLSRRDTKKTVRDSCSRLRAFLRFLRATGVLRRDLAALVAAPRVRFAERPPRALAWPDVRRLLRVVPRDRRLGRRDFAMLLMMATYGFGAAEVLGLDLDDIDWRSGIIQARRAKTGVPLELPLLPGVARALADYLRAGRPRLAGERAVFVARAMPHGRLTSGSIRHRIRLYARRAGIHAEVLGAHVLRHSHITRQVSTGTKLKIVADIVGHRRPSSASVYVRVAFQQLRTVALPVPR